MPVPRNEFGDEYYGAPPYAELPPAPRWQDMANPSGPPQGEPGLRWQDMANPGGGGAPALPEGGGDYWENMRQEQRQREGQFMENIQNKGGPVQRFLNSPGRPYSNQGNLGKQLADLVAPYLPQGRTGPSQSEQNLPKLQAQAADLWAEVQGMGAEPSGRTTAARATAKPYQTEMEMLGKDYFAANAAQNAADTIAAAKRRQDEQAAAIGERARVAAYTPQINPLQPPGGQPITAGQPDVFSQSVAGGGGAAGEPPVPSTGQPLAPPLPTPGVAGGGGYGPGAGANPGVAGGGGYGPGYTAPPTGTSNVPPSPGITPEPPVTPPTPQEKQSETAGAASDTRYKTGEYSFFGMLPGENGWFVNFAREHDGKDPVTWAREKGWDIAQMRADRDWGSRFAMEFPEALEFNPATQTRMIPNNVWTSRFYAAQSLKMNPYEMGQGPSPKYVMQYRAQAGYWWEPWNGAAGGGTAPAAPTTGAAPPAPPMPYWPANS